MTTPLPLTFAPDGLVPAVIQESATDRVLMIGFMNEEALTATRATGRVHFWSRRRGKLWRKGETSGHEQIVESIAVNCEQNSLLVRVRQLGAVCHDGFATCFYRRLEPDNSLTILYDRVFDPATIYGDGTPAADLTSSTRLLYDAYIFLAEHDLADVSSTSRRLRAGDDTVASRVADELRELAGVLDGTHQHGAFVDDLRLEATQVIYWIILSAIRAGQTWQTLRPDQALATTSPAADRTSIASMLLTDADRWQSPSEPDQQDTLRLIGAVCQSTGIQPLELIEADLAELRGKPYLARYFADPHPGLKSQAQ